MKILVSSCEGRQGKRASGQGGEKGKMGESKHERKHAVKEGESGWKWTLQGEMGRGRNGVA